jgi:4-hydroxy-tetrahydrodipicolinate synthase
MTRNATSTESVLNSKRDLPLEGIIVPMVTPFKGTHGLEVDGDALKELTDFLIENGVHGLMPLGTTGEFALLNRAERREVIRIVVERVSGRVPVIAGVSESGTDNTIALAHDAEDAGANTIIATGPYYYKTSLDGLSIHFQSILDAIKLPLMIYNIPAWTGYNIPPVVVKQLVAKNPTRLVGVKFTTNDMTLFLDYLRLLKDDLPIFVGSDALIFAALGLGAAGAVAGCANVLPNEVSSIYNYFVEGKLAQSNELQRQIEPFTQMMNLGTYPAAVKEALSMIGHHCGPVRRPLVPLTVEDREKVRSSLSWKIR